MTEYERGQNDLIDHIKSGINKLAENTTGADLPFDIINFLRKLKPIKNEQRGTK